MKKNTLDEVWEKDQLKSFEKIAVMDFGEAFKKMSDGKYIRRASWSSELPSMTMKNGYVFLMDNTGNLNKAAGISSVLQVMDLQAKDWFVDRNCKEELKNECGDDCSGCRSCIRFDTKDKVIDAVIAHLGYQPDAEEMLELKKIVDQEFGDKKEEKKQLGKIITLGEGDYRVSVYSNGYSWLSNENTNNVFKMARDDVFQIIQVLVNTLKYL